MSFIAKHVFVGMLVLFFCSGAARAGSPAQPAQASLTILFSSNVHGEYEPCG